MKRCLFCLVVFALLVPNYLTGAEPIRLGILYDASGGASDYSRYNLMNAGLAVEEINATGGVLGRPIELLKEDDGNDPNVSPLRTRTLVKRGSVGLILGSGSASVLQARVVAEAHNTPNVLLDRLDDPPFAAFRAEMRRRTDFRLHRRLLLSIS